MGEQEQNDQFETAIRRLEGANGEYDDFEDPSASGGSNHGGNPGYGGGGTGGHHGGSPISAGVHASGSMARGSPPAMRNYSEESETEQDDRKYRPGLKGGRREEGDDSESAPAHSSP